MYLMFAMPRTASRYIKKYLLSLDNKNIHFVRHANLYDAQIELNKPQNKEFWKFCFVRHPYYRFISAYKWIMMRDEKLMN